MSDIWNIKELIQKKVIIYGISRSGRGNGIRDGFGIAMVVYFYTPGNLL